MLDVRPGDLVALASGEFGTDTQLVTVTWVTLATTAAGLLAKCIGPRGQLASCTHRVRNPATRLLHGERR